MVEAVDTAELQANLKDYEEQLRQVEELLLDDPNNEEYLGIYQGLSEVVQLTRELLAEAGQQQRSAVAAAATEAPAPSASAVAAAAAITQPSELQLPSMLPPQIAQQIRVAQQRAALAGQGPAAWAIGSRTQARYSGDGQWYEATITGVSATGSFIVTFDAYGNQDEVAREDVRQQEVQAEGVDLGATYRGVEAPKRKAVNEEQTGTEELPKWLEIKPTDDEKTKAKKRKLVKSYKSKTRFQQMDTVQKEKADAWKNFNAGKGAKKKSGFFTGRKKGSMFSVPDSFAAKVGVVGSGQGMTNYGKRKRHEFGAAEEGGKKE